MADRHDTTIATLAKKTADARRGLVNVFTTELGWRVALDLMGLQNPSPAQVHMAHLIADLHHDTLARARLYLASPDMVTLLDGAAPSMPDQELHEADNPCPHGFLYFGTPLPDRSGVPPELPIHALSWARIPAEHPVLAERDVDADALLLTSYVRVADQAAIHMPDAQLVPDAPKYVPNATVMWTYGTLIGEVYGAVPEDYRHTPGFYQRVAAAFWTLAGQPNITDTSDQTPGRPADHRRYRRAGITNPNEPVHVIRLQHRMQPPEDHAGAATYEPGASGRKVGVRFAVGAFWRRQWYASIQEHRHILIPAHWRGPEDAPIQGAERVFLATPPKQPPKTG